LLVKRISRKWPAYALVRSVLDGRPLASELRAWRDALADRAAIQVEPNALQRPTENVELPAGIAVSVVLPTYGRYRYLAEVLGDLRAQTIRPAQILISDGNPPEERDHKLYEQFRDLPIEVIWDEERGMCSARNACLQRATGDYVWFVDDDSRFPADNLEQHLRVLEAYGADVSVGPAFTRGRPELHGEQREIACTFMDCGTTLCKKQLLDAVGGFDMQFNTLLPGEDGELGVRFVRAGALMVNNPLAKRFHYLAPVGGGRRSANNLHRWSRWNLMPRPVQTIYYTARRHFEPGVAWDAVLIASLAVGWRRRDDQPATRRWRARTMLAEIAALPITAYRMRKSVRIAQAMLDEGARIPALASERRGALTRESD
jgi:GT2 family glycosyltransferase